MGNVVTKNDREKIKKELYEIENKTNLSDKKNEKIDDNLLELVNKLTDYYKPILVKSSFNESDKYYERRGDKDKKLSKEQYLKIITPYLIDLMNENKEIEISSNEWNFQINMHINFFSLNDTGEVCTVFV